MGVLAILILVTFSSFSTLHFVQHIQSIQQRQSLLGDVLSLAHDSLTTSTDLPWISQQLGIDLSVVPITELESDFILYYRLQDEQVVLEQEAHGYRASKAFTRDGQRLVISGVFLGVENQLVEGVFSLARKLLEHDARSLDRYSYLTWVTTERKPLYRQSQESSILSFQTLDSYQTWFLEFTPEPTALEFGPVEFNNDLSLVSIFIVIVMAVLLTGLAVYWLVQRFEVGLQRLERASARVAAGHLNSRVKVESKDALGRLGNSFNLMAEQIQRLMGVQKEMIRAVSHELRTPVARMRFGVQILEDESQDEYLSKQLSDMDKDLQELDELVDEILTYARLEEGGPILEFKHANLLELVEQIVDETKRRTDKVVVTYESKTDAKEHLYSDIEFRYMHRAVQNLVGNACRYAKEKVHICYSFSDGLCRIDVEDDGDGIPEKDWERVFSPFTRLDDSRTRSSGGYGLGLSIVQRIIFWHGGRAQVERSVWNGAKMSLIWPQSHEED